jgi:hypothetical protein
MSTPPEGDSSATDAPLDPSLLEPSSSPAPGHEAVQLRPLIVGIERAVHMVREQGRDLKVLRGARGVVLLPRTVPPVDSHVQGTRALRYYDNEGAADCVLVLKPRGVLVYACAGA